MRYGQAVPKKKRKPEENAVAGYILKFLVLCCKITDYMPEKNTHALWVGGGILGSKGEDMRIYPHRIE